MPYVRGPVTNVDTLGNMTYCKTNAKYTQLSHTFDSPLFLMQQAQIRNTVAS